MPWELNSDRRRTCPFCGQRVCVNDFLFRTDRRIPLAADVKLATYEWKCSGQLSRWEEDVEFQHTVPRQLVNWRKYPQEQVWVEDGVVMGVTDYTGCTYTQRACPWCHNRMPDEAFSNSAFSIFIQDELRERVMRAFQAAKRQNTLRMIRAGQSQAVYCQEALGYFCGEEPETDKWEQRKNRTIGQECDRSVFFLALEPPDVNEGTSIDETAQTWLRQTLQGYFAAFYIGIPAVVVLALDEQTEMQKVEQLHGVLFAHLKASFPQIKCLLWAAREQELPGGWEQAVSWMLTAGQDTRG